MSTDAYYQDEAVTIYHGDCLEILPRLAVTVDALLTDPPYAVPTSAAQARNALRSTGDLSIIETAMRIYFQEALARLNPQGRAFVFCDGTSYPVLFRVLYSHLQTALLVWSKGQIGMGREFRKSHELILHGWRANTPIFADGIGRADVLSHPPVPPELRLHPAEKPASLLAELLRVCGGSILDPFMGSGATLRAAKDLGRKAVGIEIEEKYCEIAAKRMAQEVLCQ